MTSQRIVAALLCTILVACSDESSPQGAAGAAADASPEASAGTGGQGGTQDAGPEADTGTPDASDTGTPPDAEPDVTQEAQPVPACANKVAGLPLPYTEVYGVDAVEDRAYLAARDDEDHLRFFVVDISTPDAPSLHSDLDLGTTPPSVVPLEGTQVVIWNEYGLMLGEAATPPGSPVPQHALDFGAHVDVDAALAYAPSDMALVIADLSDPLAPTVLSELPLPSPTRVEVRGSLAFVTHDWGLAIIDVTDPTAPVKVGDFFTSDWADTLDVSGDRVYLTNINQGLHIVDVSDPALPVELNHAWVVSSWAEIRVAGDTAFLAYRDNLLVVDAHDPAAPVIAGKHWTASHAQGIDVEGTYAYVANASFSTQGYAHPGELEVWDVSGCLSGATAGDAGAGGSGGGNACDITHIGVPPCDDCLRVRCQSECGDLRDHPDLDPLMSCQAPCTDSACRRACEELYWSAAHAQEMLMNCYTARCYWPCQGAPNTSCILSANSATCHTCLRDECKTDCVAAGLEPTIWDYLMCANECSDQACLAQCDADYPNAANALDSLSGCLHDQCGTECEAM